MRLGYIYIYMKLVIDIIYIGTLYFLKNLDNRKQLEIRNRISTKHNGGYCTCIKLGKPNSHELGKHEMQTGRVMIR